MSAESAFIAALRAIATHPAARGLNDDAAVLDVGGETLVLTHDTMVEGVHFLPEQDPADVAWKLIATNISDLAAKGAQPLAVLLSYQLGRDDAAFLDGLKAALRHYGDAALLGGDTVRAPGPQSVGLTAIGRATHRPVPSRDGAAVGDALWITGPVGAAMLGMEALKAGTGDSTAYRRPIALLAEGQRLAPLVSAIMDVSDGVLLDASRMAIASGVTIAVDRMAVPIAVPEQRRDEALRWGDDYQLLFTLPAGIIPPCPASRIGTVVERQDTPVLLDGAPVSGRLGYEHG
ncbi:thiamine-phosphate kinase [Novosphingobium arvoryzae]|uniref:thiamine-phosphate kinase n=1 Tax=Novosphingobium arvoryzae TaxID=1256514 RepID=UPI0035B47C84